MSGSNLQRIINDSCADVDSNSSDFWVMVAALKAVSVRPLSTVNSLVRFAEEPQMFAIEFNDGCLILVYDSTSHDSLLAAVRDLLQTEVGSMSNTSTTKVNNAWSSN
ncbi:hypothetical protein LOK49_LG01G04030 [Camellia lanceoleosa]|uniref:Uncharacterized protein n=1 Tax=Camellia lanceoleosa TaxID=1840588 RepID=A0ACC0J3U7_9ERIC|nr:hypothetical protein LOK49_LG01G04030 [Camellia lanceoleosa]